MKKILIISLILFLPHGIKADCERLFQDSTLTSSDSDMVTTERATYLEEETDKEYPPLFPLKEPYEDDSEDAREIFLEDVHDSSKITLYALGAQALNLGIGVGKVCFRVGKGIWWISSSLFPSSRIKELLKRKLASKALITGAILLPFGSGYLYFHNETCRETINELLLKQFTPKQLITLGALSGLITTGIIIKNKGFLKKSALALAVGCFFYTFAT